MGTVLITGPTGGLGRAATLAMAERRPPNGRTCCCSGGTAPG
jgi:hypothetical protein